MFCEAYNQSLKDAAASGELSPALREHLGSCESCRAVFAQEQFLYNAVDTGLRAAANPEVPSTLLPRVRVAVNIETSLTVRPLSANLLIAGGIAAAFLCVLMISRFPRSGIKQYPAVTSPVVVNTPVSQDAQRRSVNPASTDGVYTSQQKRPIVAKLGHASDPELPEILVSSEDAAAWRQYEDFLHKRSTGVVMTAGNKSVSMPEGIEPLQIAEIEIHALSKPYAEGDLK